MTGKQLIDIGTAKLQAGGIDNARREAMFILASSLDCEPAACYLVKEISENIEREFDEKLERRLKGEPLQIIVGKWEFYGRPILLRSGVFVPRPETEGLIDIIKERLPKRPDMSGLEIGVGSGAISVNLLAEMPYLRMTATDISSTAISLARVNARNIGVEDRLKLVQTEIAKGIEGSFDFVVSNPPYVTTTEMDDLPMEVRHDPKNALLGGTDGMDVSREIVLSTSDKMKPGGLIALEIHEDKGDEMLEMLSLVFVNNIIIRDISGKDRYVIGYKGN